MSSHLLRPAHDAPTQGDNPPDPAESRAPARAISSDRLFGGAQELHIDHCGTMYRLRKTSLGKLILTK